ncbi:peptidyl-prolyl cis-trans isomerase [Bacteroidia bacterium]|nr:peptidyl-prolyl cis-trans isomerase [Bacteroidia bacterium]
MKKLVNVSLFSLVAGLGITLFSCNGQPKAELKNDIDSLSYVAGINVTQGLEQYLNQLGVDSTLMKVFVAGLLDGAKVDKEDKKPVAKATGFQIGQQISQQMIPSLESQFFGGDSTLKINTKDFLAGFIGAATHTGLKIAQEEAQGLQTSLVSGIKLKAFAPVIAENQKYLDDNKSNEGVVTTESGLQYKITTTGKGAIPTATDVVKVHYHGTTITGEVFDSSIESGKPAEFPVNGVIRGWTELLQLLPVGSKATAYIPYDLAYGEQGAGGKIGPYATLIFEIELIEIVKKDEKKK